MTRITFISADGEARQTIDGAAGERLLDLAQAQGQPLEGTCEGQMACSTCHVIIDPKHFDALPEALEMEEDMLDLAAGACRTSRLACQIWCSDDLPELTVKMPPVSRNMQGA